MPETGLHYETLVLRRTKKVLLPDMSMSDAGVVDDDILDVVWTGWHISSALKSNRNWIGLFNRKDHPNLTPQERYLDDVVSCIEEYTVLSSRCDVAHNVLQFVVIAGAVMVSTLLAISQVPHWIPVVASGVVTICAMMDNFYRFVCRSDNHYLFAESMQRENVLYTLSSGHYKDKTPDDAFQQFITSIENFRDEHRERIREMRGNKRLKQDSEIASSLLSI